MNTVQHVFFAVAIVCWVTGFALSFFKIRPRAQRRIYWGNVGVGAVSGFLVGYPDLGKGVGIAGFVVVTMTLAAYLCTPYLKIGNKIHRLVPDLNRPDSDDARLVDGAQSGQRENSRPRNAAGQHDSTPDSYGGVLTPARLWWIMVALAAIIAGGVCMVVAGRGGPVTTAAAVGFYALMAALAGHGDSSWGYPIARGQYVQFAVISVITAGGFTVTYLIAYYAGRLWPLRRRNSMEYRAHPRHQKQERQT